MTLYWLAMTYIIILLTLIVYYNFNAFHTSSLNKTNWKSTLIIWYFFNIYLCFSLEINVDVVQVALGWTRYYTGIGNIILFQSLNPFACLQNMAVLPAKVIISYFSVIPFTSVPLINLVISYYFAYLQNISLVRVKVIEPYYFIT